ncbi:CopD family protein [Devosia sp. WQ 349]|uniref:CopD family protein n=1 Tax=Devosia sp. WQ 349K1 TaxID=2800329 RepID=UPI0019047B03|nr:CopD family protein [Devosia sp. WQ 349K1]MBK1796234.1 CopD family protein [Devosia sp. WQ 349K1]
MGSDLLLIWLKFAHVGSIALWSAGLICLPVLYAQRKALVDEPLHRLHNFTRLFYIALVSPAAFVAIGSGTALIILQGTYENWFSAKLFAVSIMTGIHIFTGLTILKLFEPHKSYPLWRMVLVITLTVIVILTILTLVLGKPRLEWPEFFITHFSPGKLREIASDLTGGWK